MCIHRYESAQKMFLQPLLALMRELAANVPKAGPGAAIEAPEEAFIEHVPWVPRTALPPIIVEALDKAIFFFIFIFVQCLCLSDLFFGAFVSL